MYYQDYLDSTEAQAAMKRVENTLKKQNQEARAAAVVTGATPEAAIAQQQANNEILDETATGLAAQATARKAQVEAVDQQNQNDDAGFLPSSEDCGTDTEELKLPRHKNIRGREYFSKTNISNNLKTDSNENK